MGRTDGIKKFVKPKLVSLTPALVVLPAAVNCNKLGAFGCFHPCF